MATMRVELDGKEIEQACKEYILRQHGLEVVGTVALTAASLSDAMDRPTGGHAVTASALVRARGPVGAGKD